MGYPRLAGSNHRPGRGLALLARDDDDDDQRQNAEEEAKNAPAEVISALRRRDRTAHDGRDDAADEDEDALDASKDEPGGLGIVLRCQHQSVQHVPSPSSL